jgi:hypothetical protein
MNRKSFEDIGVVKRKMNENEIRGNSAPFCSKRRWAEGRTRT